MKNQSFLIIPVLLAIFGLASRAEFQPARGNVSARLLCSPLQVLDYAAKSVGDRQQKFAMLHEKLQAQDASDLILVQKESCSAHGCHYLLFAHERACYRPIGEVSGRLEVLETRKNGFHTLRITQMRAPPAKPLAKDWSYSENRRGYVEE